MIKEVDQQSFDMRTVVILQLSLAVLHLTLDLDTNLISHQHKPSISQSARVRVILVVLQAHNLFDILNFLVLHDLIMLRLSYIQQFPA
jgi:hypothetical protein